MKRRTSVITQRIVLSAPPEKIYEAFMDPKRHSEFTGSKATGKAKIGAKFTTWDGYISGRNLELEKGKCIVQEWVTTDWPKDYLLSKLEITFNQINGKTQLIMVHCNVPAEQKQELEQGWTDYYWKPLKNYLEKQNEKQNGSA